MGIICLLENEPGVLYTWIDARSSLEREKFLRIIDSFKRDYKGHWENKYWVFSVRHLEKLIRLYIYLFGQEGCRIVIVDNRTSANFQQRLF
jgi:hypothetical protein